MKRIKFIVPLVTLLFSVACNDSFMERQPLDSVSEAAYWNTPQDLRLYANMFYARGWGGEATLFTEDSWNSIGPYGYDADNGADTQVKDAYNTRMNAQGTVPTSGGQWDAAYWTRVRTCTVFFDNYKKVEERTSAADVNPYLGEVLFFHSLIYFDKLRRFGPVPWIETTLQLDSEELYAPRMPRNELVTKILANLDKAIEYLPAKGTGTWSGRITKEIALTLASRIALYEGTWEKYHAGTDFAAPVNESAKFLEKAASLANQLMVMGETVGYPAIEMTGPDGPEYAYRDFFNRQDYYDSKEAIFWRHFETTLANNMEVYSANGARRGATKSLIDSYLKIDGTPVTPGYDDSSLQAVVKDRDPRLAQTIQVNDGNHWRYREPNPAGLIQYFTAPAFDGVIGQVCTTGYQTYKGHDFRMANQPSSGTGVKALLWYRFGEVLLNFAEAKAELGTLTQGDLDRSINLLRDRVQMPHMILADLRVDPNFEFSELGAVIQEVRRERKVELALEGFRVDDIMRWAAADELLIGIEPKGAKIAQWQNFKFADQGVIGEADKARQEAFETAVRGLAVDEDGYIRPFKTLLPDGFKFNPRRDYLFPIPLNQLTLNPQLEQNPGWD